MSQSEMLHSLEWIESFTQDLHDKNQFKEAFLRALKPIGRKRFKKVPFKPYPYQKAYSDDDNPLKLTSKSRQVGFTYNTLMDTLHDSIMNEKYKKLLVSLTQPHANELLKTVYDAVELLDEPYTIPFKVKRDSRLELPNGSRIIALPSTASAARSFHGDVFIDEVAHIPKLQELLDAIMQITVRAGYNIEIGSTPFGQRGYFHQILKDAGWDTTRSWEKIKDAKEFLFEYHKFLKNHDSEWSIHMMPWWMCEDLLWERITARANGDTLRQEYGMAFLDETTALITYELMRDRVNKRIVTYDPLKLYARPEDSRLIFGVDPAEVVNQTALVVFQNLRGVYYKRYVQLWSGKDHFVYNDVIARLFKRWKGDMIYLDSTGMGKPVYHDLIKRCGISPHRIEAVNLNNTNKEDLAMNLLGVYEAGKGQGRSAYKIQTDYDRGYMNQLHQLRREITEYGRSRFTGKIEGKDDDIIWATALALFEELGDFAEEFRVEKGSYKEDNRRQNRDGNRY